MKRLDAGLKAGERRKNGGLIVALGEEFQSHVGLQCKRSRVLQELDQRLFCYQVLDHGEKV